MQSNEKERTFPKKFGQLMGNKKLQITNFIIVSGSYINKYRRIISTKVNFNFKNINIAHENIRSIFFHYWNLLESKVAYKCCLLKTL